MQSDYEGFVYPNVNNEKCIDCHLCEKVCPALNIKPEDNSKPEAYAAYNKNEDIRIASSSGGIFSLIAEHILNDDGVVFGAAFDKAFAVEHVCVDRIEDIAKLRGSKYLQSRIGETYREAKEYLESGKKVLFTGTPCQIEGLLSYLGKDYDNLYTQDIICHGVPSPMVWDKYVDYREKRSASKTQRTFFRHKNYGWKMFSVLFQFENNTEYVETLDKDIYMKSFLKNLCLRPSCYSCQFMKFHRNADITLADFWGIDQVCPELDDDKGTSLVFVHSKKGEELFNAINSSIVYSEVNAEEAIQYNSCMIKSVAEPEGRKAFMKEILKRDFPKALEKALPVKCKNMGQAVRTLKNAIKETIGDENYK